MMMMMRAGGSEREGGVSVHARRYDLLIRDNACARMRV